MRRFVWWFAPTLSIAAATFLLVGPTMSSARSAAVGTPRSQAWQAPMVTESTFLLASQGLSILPVLLVPVALTLLPLLGSGVRARTIIGIAAAALLAGFCYLGMMSVGWFYVPSLVALLVAVGLAASTARRAAV